MIVIATPAATVSAADSIADDYAGSGACQGCHTYIYNSWRSTRHSYSVRTAAEAKQAGYPLPRQVDGGEVPGMLDWSDISYVIGGRQRIAYVDKLGRVQNTSFHHRIGGWDNFPTLEMPVCAECHYTGVGAGVAHPGNPALPGRWSERNIGCEACHGAGASHVESLEKNDIVKNPSSKVCGQCHTEVGKILPKGELHDTHDLLQIWNQDRHVTGVRRHSHNAFCSSCHSPYDGHALGSGLDSGRKVFTEQKLNITCIGCHDPHAMTLSAYQRETVSLEQPLTIRSHSFEGNDNDFTTTDHRQWNSAAESCLRCHRGADRVDLDHANATCVDCHNTYNRNHSRESRQFHDSNQPGLSCLGCHDDADYLMSILYGDPDFLDPRHIHNLRTLPAQVRERYGFRYSSLRQPESVVKSQPVAETDETDTKPDASPAITPSTSATLAALRELLDRDAHARLARHASIQPLRDTLIGAPGSPSAHLGLAQAYADLGELTLARELLEHASRLDSSRLLLELPFLSSPLRGEPRKAGDAGQTSIDVLARVAALLPESATAEDAAVRTWLHAYMEIVQGNFDAAAAVLDDAPDNATAGLHRSLVVYGTGNFRQALKLLEANIEAYPTHHASAAAIGLMHLNRKRSAPAEAAFERAISIAPAEGSARLLLGLARTASGNLEGAVQAYRDAVEVEPSLIAARFLMAHAYQLGGRADAAARVYGEIIELEPKLFEARYALANVLKLLSDQITFRLREEQESNPPTDMRPDEWRSRHSQWQQQVVKYRNRALTELAVAVQLRPAALDATRQVAEIYRGSQRLDEARRFYQRLIELEPEVWLHRYRLGTIWFALGDYLQAVNELTRVTVMAPTDGDAYLALGLALVRAGRLNQAIAVFETATTYEPFNPGLYTNLGAAYANRGDLSKAQAAFERSLELHSFPLPRVHLTHTNLALVHLRTGRHDEAVFELRRALHQYADYPLAGELLTRATQAPQDSNDWPEFVYNEWLERFGEVTTVAFSNE